MKQFLSGLGRLTVTLVAVIAAVAVATSLWSYYIDAPWTRDGRVRADVITISADVAGMVSSVHIHDNQTVHRGDILFTVDNSRYRLAVEQAQAVVESRSATLRHTTLDMKRYAALSDIATSRQKQEQATADMQTASAAYQQAVADLELARLNLERTVVRAPVDGALTNFSMQPGQYVSVGKGVAALVVTGSLHVDGYFEETRLPRIQVGDPVSVRLMGESCILRGHVESIAIGTEDRERTDSSNLLANVNPTFSWVRLAQRVPVRIALETPSAASRLIVGRTATVVVENSYMQPSWYSHGLIRQSLAAALPVSGEPVCTPAPAPATSPAAAPAAAPAAGGAH